MCKKCICIDFRMMAPLLKLRKIVFRTLLETQVQPHILAKPARKSVMVSPVSLPLIPPVSPNPYEGQRQGHGVHCTEHGFFLVSSCFTFCSSKPVPSPAMVQRLLRGVLRTIQHPHCLQRVPELKELLLNIPIFCRVTSITDISFIGVGQSIVSDHLYYLYDTFYLTLSFIILFLLILFNLVAGTTIFCLHLHLFFFLLMPN